MIFFRYLLTGPYVLCVQPNLALHRHLSHDRVCPFFEHIDYKVEGGFKPLSAVYHISNTSTEYLCAQLPSSFITYSSVSPPKQVQFKRILTLGGGLMSSLQCNQITDGDHEEIEYKDSTQYQNSQSNIWE